MNGMLLCRRSGASRDSMLRIRTLGTNIQYQTGYYQCDTDRTRKPGSCAVEEDDLPQERKDHLRRLGGIDRSQLEGGRRVMPRMEKQARGDHPGKEGDD